MPDTASDNTGPDFLCIGMQKAGTKWLYDSLDSCPGFWMPPIKEFHFFDRGFLEADVRDRLAARNVRHCRELLSVQPAGARRSRSRPARNIRDHEFCERWISMADTGYRLDDYLALFKFKESSLSGDVTPSYSALTENDVELVRSALPGLKIILLVRDPVARAWSSFNMYLRDRKISKAERRRPYASHALQEKATVAELSRYMNQPWCRQRSFPSVSYGRWASVFGKRQVHVTFFQDIVNRPVSVIEDVCKFLDVALESPPVPAMNVKAKAPRAAMTDEHKAFLNDYFKGEYVAMRALFPERATEWDPQ